MKVLNNMVCASTLAATFEAMVLGAKAGLDADAMLRVLQVSSGRNFHTEDKIGRNVLPGTFDYGFQLGLMLKDVGLCLALADELGVPMPSSEAVRGLYEEAVRRSGETADITTLIAPLEEWAGPRSGALDALGRDDLALEAIHDVGRDRERGGRGGGGGVAHVQRPLGREKTKSSTRLPSRATACARTPAKPPSRSSARSSGT